ncbi:MAG: YidC/Oxa1 family insertase periplasmic-domain containing protein [Planctomycetota bacterium]|nr:YidC/Oxa1 family insertase periplasmic-domain containing protein [Planctomycetota bacterium]
MSQTTAKPASIDLVKIGMIALAVAIYLGGQSFLRSHEEARLERWKNENPEAYEAWVKEREDQALAHAEGAKTGEAGKTPETVEGKTGETPAFVAKTGEVAKTAGAPADPVKNPVEAPPQTEVAKVDDVELGAGPDDPGPLTLVFSQDGAALRRARLAREKVLATTPDDERGLEILDEIQPGKRSLALVYFKFGDREFKDLESRRWEQAPWEPAGEDDAEASGVAYATTLLDGDAPMARVTKRFTLPKDRPHVILSLAVENLTGRETTYAYQLRGPAGILLDGPPENPQQGAYALIKLQMAGRILSAEEPEIEIEHPYEPAKEPKLEDRRVSSEENLWAALTNRFFMAAVLAEKPGQIVQIVADGVEKGKREDKLADKRFLEANISPIFYRKTSEPLAGGATSAPERFVLYLGPLQPNLVREWEAGLGLSKPYHLEQAVQYCDVWGTRWPRIDWLAGVLLLLFRGLQHVSGSYGLAVIVLTLIVKLALHPFQRKMTVSMHKMQMLQPKLNAIEEKYKNQTKPEMRQKKEMEKWDLMRSEGVNPTMGCLPMLLQMPIFFALYGTFSHAFEMRHASFLWVKDLSLSDRVLTFSAWPNELNLLPIIYIVMTLITTLRAPKAPNADPNQELQRKIMSFMPVMFGFLFYKFPAGLILYFAASACFGLLESWYVKRFVLKVDRHGQPLLAAA